MSDYEKKKTFKKKSSEKSYSGDDDYSNKDGDRKGSWKRKERPSIDLILDYKDVDSLKPFIAEGGRLVPSRVNRLNRRQQRELTTQVKRARQLALVPLSDRHSPMRSNH